MEIFQNIWTAITMPNEGLIQILGIPLTYLDAYIGMFFFTTILNICVSKTQKLIYVLFYATTGCVMNVFIPQQYAIFFNIFIWPFFIYFILKTSILKTILAEISVLVITSILDAILANIALLLFNADPSQLLPIPFFRISFALLIYLVMWLLTLCIKYCKLNIIIFDNLHQKTKIYITLNCILMIVILFMQFYLIMFFTDSMPILITVISIIRNYRILFYQYF